MTVFASTDRPKSVFIRCIIERFFGLLCYFKLCTSIAKGVCHTIASDLFLSPHFPGVKCGN